MIGSLWKCIFTPIDHSVTFVLCNRYVTEMGLELAAVFGRGQGTEEERKWTRSYRRRTFPMENNRQ